MRGVNRWQNYVSIETDYWAMLLALLFLSVIAGSLALVPWVNSMGVEQAMGGSSAAEQAAAGGGWAIAEAIAAVIILGAIAAWRLLPEWAREIVKDNLTIGLWMLNGAGAYVADVFLPVMAAAIGLLTIAKTAVRFEVYWLLHNVFAVGVAILGAVLLGVTFPLPFLVIGLVGLTVYDHVFANQQDWMMKIGEGLLCAKLPVVVFAFPKLRVDWDDLCDAIADEEEEKEQSEFFPDKKGFGIGTADLLLPAALAVAVVKTIGTPVGGVIPAVGLTIGVIIAAFRLRWELINTGSGAGLPAITSGAFGGWAVGIMVVMSV